jgi:hypothetical protein
MPHPLLPSSIVPILSKSVTVLFSFFESPITYAILNTYLVSASIYPTVKFSQSFAPKAFSFVTSTIFCPPCLIKYCPYWIAYFSDVAMMVNENTAPIIESKLLVLAVTLNYLFYLNRSVRFITFLRPNILFFIYFKTE